MLTKTKIICASLCALNLSACMTSGSRDEGHYQTYDNQASPLYPDGYDTTVVYGNNPYETTREVMTPESYHLGTSRPPVSSKDLDKTWVSSQSPNGYTIQLSNDEKASHVAGVLQKIPKNERMAEIKYQHDGKTSYKGLYGSYPSAEAAHNALNTLPNDIKQGAQVEPWGTIQQEITE